ncbi:MAG: hypothetical protein PHY02_07650 [Phycisphaerae bacterium]|nr:hypothetical protein [Phycisphaerae bacterium]
MRGTRLFSAMGVLCLWVCSLATATQPFWSPDLNGDEFVDFADFAMLAENWQKSGAGLDGDLDDNGIVDVNDLEEFSWYWLEEIFFPPVAEGNSVSVTQAKSVTITLEASDEDDETLAYFTMAYPSNGTLTLDGNTATYTSLPDYDGNDSFTFFAYDGKYESNTATISITVLPDTDGDGLSDYDEINGTYGYVTNPNDADTDSDGMPDNWEIENGLNPTINDSSGDTDSDGLNNADEYAAGTDLWDSDSDDDGLTDGDEASYGAKPLNPDTDGDSINDGVEASWGFDPNNPDTDDDGVNDYVELCYNGNCSDYHPYPWAGHDWDDCDLNADSNDTDGDGRLDGWEVEYQTIAYSRFIDPRISSDGGYDADMDQLTNAQEYNAGTNPTDGDTDGDGLDDEEEIYTYFTNPLKIDSDDDRLVDGWHDVVPVEDYPEGVSSGKNGAGYNGHVWGEIPCGTNPNNQDSDGDGMPDGWEADHWDLSFHTYFDPDYDGGWAGYDFENYPTGDGLTNLEESQLGADPWDSDTDNDGLSDGDEVNTYGADPLKTDSDGDGISDWNEVVGGTEPGEFDSDGDLLSDSWEIGYGLNPLVMDNIYSDTDGDGLTLLKELIYSTNPTQPDTDSDGTNDGAEATQGSYPASASDNGEAPSADEICELRLTVGDWSSSESERYDMVVYEEGGTSPFVIHHQGPVFGVVTTNTYNQFRAGKRYEVKVVHLGTIWPEGADYDYEAKVEAAGLPVGVVMTIDDPYNPSMLGTHGDDSVTKPFYAAGKTAYVDFTRPDLKIYNGGNNGSSGAMVSEGDEENVGAYLLVNCDDDNGDDTPDLYESGTGPDDDLAKIELSAEQLNEGTLELIKTGSIKLWQDQNKSAEQTTLTWDLATTTPPSTLWVEGVGRSSAERDMGLELRHINGSVTTSDKVKMTVVMINLGNIVCRALDLFGIGNLSVGHSGVVVEYTGECTPSDFNDSSKFWVVEMPGPDEVTLGTFTDIPHLPSFGCYSWGLEYTNRLRIVKTAKALRDQRVNYTFIKVLLPSNWNNTITDIDYLRCDGLTEVCYEINGKMVWGKIVDGSTHYDIRVDSYQEEHNEFVPLSWKQHMAPATQCGHGDFEAYRGTYWQTTLYQLNLCQPIGHTGGN